MEQRRLGSWAMVSSSDMRAATHDALALGSNRWLCDGRLENVSIAIWATPATLEISKRLEAATFDLIRAYPQGISSVHVILDKTPLPTAEARTHLREITERYAKNVACVGTVVDGDGFWASAMRSFLTSLHWLSRRPFKAHYASSIEELAEWLPPFHAQKTGVVIQPADLTKSWSNLERVSIPASPRAR